MKKTLLSIVLLAIAIISPKANISFDANKTYRILCTNNSTGGICLGTDHSNSTPLYYLASSNNEADQFWYLTNMGEGKYTIKNAKTNQYVTFDESLYTTAGSNGATLTQRYITLTNEVKGDSSLWSISASGDGYTIENALNTNQIFNVRNNLVVGTYQKTGSPSGNEVFNFYDKDGKIVTETSTESNNYGTTDDGYYWENTGVASPIVYTDNTSNPVLYYIKNVRSEKFVSVNNNSSLCQTDNRTNAFYFVKGTDGGTNIYTVSGDNHYYVSGYVPNNDIAGVTITSGTTSTSDNTWSLGYYDTEYNGYTLSVKTCSSNSNWSYYYYMGYIYWNDYSNSTIGFYTADGGGTFAFYSNDSRHRDLLLSYGYDVPSNGTVATSEFSDIMDTLKIEGKIPPYDKLYKTYMQPIKTAYSDEGKTYTAKINYNLKKTGNYSLYINKTKVENGGSYTFSSLGGNNSDSLEIRLDDQAVVATSAITFTFLPVVEMTCSSFNGSTYTTGQIRVNDADNSALDSLFIAAYKYRGASAQGYSKKSYAIKLKDDKGESVDRTFLGMRDDNNWILDAMAVDRARMRNRVTTDLWLDFSEKPYHYKSEPKAVNGTHGRFVEVLINGSYVGLYCMTEKIDRKQLKLKKLSESSTANNTDTIRGVLYKSSSWSYSVFMGHYSDTKSYPMKSPSSYSTSSETWDSWEMKYPDMEDMQETLSNRDTLSWNPLWDAVNYVASKPNSQLLNDVNLRFDLPVLRDYYLLLEVSLATDNHGKNLFMHTYNIQKSKKMSVTPWDLDGTWGRNWAGSSSYTKATADFVTMLWSYEHGEHTLFKRLMEIDYDGWNSKLAERYKELRKTYFKKDELTKRFTIYYNLVSASGATSREEKRWSLSSQSSEMDYISTWISSRIDKLDEQYGYKEDEVPDGISSAKADEIYAAGGKGFIAVRSDKATTVDLFSVEGIKVKTLQLNKGLNQIGNIKAGAYILNNQKVFVR